MPLRVVEITDLRDFTLAFITARGVPNLDPHNQDLSEGASLGNRDGTTSGSEYMYGCYFHNAEMYMWNQFSKKNDSVTAARQMYEAAYAHDALCRDSGRGWWIPISFQPTFGSNQGFTYHFGFGGSPSGRWVVGQPNLQTGAQSFYAYGNLVGTPNATPDTYVAGWHRFNCPDGARQNVFENYWPAWGSPLNSTVSGAATGATAGFWEGSSSNQDEYHAIVFEGITDTTGGMPGETSSSGGMLRGGTSHPLGLMLVRSRASNFLGDGTGNNTGRRWIWVDITTGLAVGVLGSAFPVDSFTTDAFHDDNIAGHNFEWSGIQFVPDEGSSFEAPKGELHFFLCDQGLFQLDNQSITPENTGIPFTSLVNQQHVKVVDFNPFNDTSGAVRVHNRQRLLATYNIPCEPMMDGGADVVKNGTTHTYRSAAVYYHPASRSWCNVSVALQDAQNRGTDDPEPGFSRIIRWARTTEIGLLTTPVPVESVKESSTVEARLTVIDDFGDPIAGETINFRTLRHSTRDEQFDGTVQATSNYVVDNAVIDNDGSLEIYSGGGIDSGGTLLAESTDYTVSSYATGTLAPVGSWPTDTVSVRYRHRSSTVRPGFGTLLNATSTSNSDGVITVFIELGADLLGELAGVEADSETF